MPSAAYAERGRCAEVPVFATWSATSSSAGHKPVARASWNGALQPTKQPLSRRHARAKTLDRAVCDSRDVAPRHSSARRCVLSCIEVRDVSVSTASWAKTTLWLVASTARIRSTQTSSETMIAAAVAPPLGRLRSFGIARHHAEERAFCRQRDRSTRCSFSNSGHVLDRQGRGPTGECSSTYWPSSARVAPADVSVSCNRIDGN